VYSSCFFDDIRFRSARLGPAFLFDDFVFESGATVFGLVATVFQGPNFKGALIELSFDLGAPFGYRFLVFF
jgi:hypothetical protein